MPRQIECIDVRGGVRSLRTRGDGAGTPQRLEPRPLQLYHFIMYVWTACIFAVYLMACSDFLALSALLFKEKDLAFR